MFVCVAATEAETGGGGGDGILDHRSRLSLPLPLPLAHSTHRVIQSIDLQKYVFSIFDLIKNFTKDLPE